MVVETMKKEHLSIYTIDDRSYLSAGDVALGLEGTVLITLEGFAVERRGRGSTGRPKKLPKEVEEDLLAEVQRLRAENDYLKNLQALVLEDERRQRRKRR